MAEWISTFLIGKERWETKSPRLTRHGNKFVESVSFLLLIFFFGGDPLWVAGLGATSFCASGSVRLNSFCFGVFVGENVKGNFNSWTWVRICFAIAYTKLNRPVCAGSSDCRNMHLDYSACPMFALGSEMHICFVFFFNFRSWIFLWGI